MEKSKVRKQFPGAVAVELMAVAGDIIEIADHSGQNGYSRRSEDREGRLGRAVIVQIEANETDRRMLGTSELRHRITHVAEHQLSGFQP